MLHAMASLPQQQRAPASLDTAALRLEVLSGEPHRGGTVRARLEVEDGEPTEVGLVSCVRSLDDEQLGEASEDTRLASAVAQERWVTVEPGAVEQIVDLPVPTSGPYSYDGDVLSFSSRVVARRRFTRESNGAVEQPVQILP